MVAIKKLQGGTIIEAVVSMTILMIIFVAVSAVVLNGVKSQNINAKTKAFIIIGNEIALLNKSKTAVVFERNYSNFSIKSSVSDLDTAEDLFLYSIEAQSMSNKRVVCVRRVMLPYDEFTVISDGNGRTSID